MLDVSSYDLIARQDADDKSYNSRLHKQFEYLDKKNLDFVFSKSLYKKKIEYTRFSNNVPNSIVIKFKNPFIHGTLLGKKNIIFKLGKYNEDFYYAQDYKLLNDIIKSGYKVKIINEVLYESNFENNISTIKKEQQSYYADCVRKYKTKPKVHMKIYINDVNEDWIVDRFRKEFYQYNQNIVTTDISKADIIWVISPWAWRKVPKRFLSKKKLFVQSTT